MGKTDAALDLTRGERLRRLRREAGLSQDELAARAGISARSVGNLERDAPHAPRRETLRLLAEALGLVGVEREWLLGTAPRARPGSPPSAVPHNLPAPPGPLIGRAAELATVRGALRRSGARLVTLAGPGGVGKTRLAVAAAAETRPAFPDGAWFVDLSPIADPDLVLATVAQTLGLPPPDDRPAAEVLTDHLRQRRTLIVLDNCEQVLPAATAVADLLAACPGLTVLATSREPLRLRWEHRVPVPPLPVPEPDAPPVPERLVRVASVRLFVERARAATPDFALDAGNAAAVAAICARLDGLPLAIELAAARVSQLSPAAMLARLERSLRVLRWEANDLPARHRTLRAAIDWSYDLLPVAERALFRRIAVFAGGFTPAAAAHVGGTDALGLDAFAALAALAEKGLVRVLGSEEDGPRFGLLETMREYGLERLAGDGELDRTRTRHAEHFLALAERAEPELTGPNQVAWLGRLEGEHDNLRAALRWAAASGASDLGLRLAAALWRFWWGHGHLAEGQRWLETTLADAAGAWSATRATALRAAGVLASFRADYDRATTWLAESEALFRALGDRRGVAQAVANQGTVAYYRGDYATARARYEAALASYRAVGTARDEASALSNLGMVVGLEGDHARAVTLLEASLALFRRLGDQQHVASALGNLAAVARDGDDLATADAYFAQVLALQRELGHTWGIAVSLASLGETAWAMGDAERALALCGEGLTLSHELGDANNVAYCLELIGSVIYGRGDTSRAARAWGAASALRAATGTPIPAPYRAAYDEEVDAARETLGDGAFTLAWEAGRARPLDEAVTEALAATSAEDDRRSTH